MPQTFNYLTFDEPGPDSAVVEFSAHRFTQRTITDPITGKAGMRDLLEFDVAAVDGRPWSGKYSTMSSGEVAQWRAWLDGDRYKGRKFRITKQGSGFQRATTIEAIP